MYVALMGGKTDVYKILILKPVGKRLLAIHKRI
jgi:hypothetical protein